MWSRLLVLLVLVGAMTGCEKARGWLGQADAGGGPGRVEVRPGGDAEPSLASLVARQGAGVRFRRDLLFPSRLKVWVQVRLDYTQVRLVETSALGKEMRTLDHATETEFECSKGPGIFDLQLLKAARERVANVEKNGKVELLPGRSAALEQQSLCFLLSDRGWRPRQEAGAVDFRRAVWSEAVGDEIPRIMVEAGVHPRTQWFDPNRVWHAGDKVDLVGGWLRLLDPFADSGRVTLQFAGEEAIGGHPCGVFAVEGALRVKGQTQPDGVRQDSEITINSGKVWASLLYPVLLREEYDTVQTTSERPASGGTARRLQGAIAVRKLRNWIPGEG